MNTDLIQLIYILNPWLQGTAQFYPPSLPYVPRLQLEKLLLPDWDQKWLVLVGPRQAGKTTLGKHIVERLIHTEKRFQEFFYLNCDFLEIREWLKSPIFLQEALREFSLKKPVVFIDEVQRLENPGLLLKSIADLKLPIKMIASGSSQLEIKSKIQEFLTGRQLEVLIFPLSYREIGQVEESCLIYGCYPEIVWSVEKEILLQQLYNDYINKDIIEILKVRNPDVVQKLIILLAHSSGQLVNYNQLATDCRVSIPTIQHYCSILENTYTIYCVKPFVGNKRKEIVSNPIYYFLDNGFRNQALRQFSDIQNRADVGLLMQSAVFQEIAKYRTYLFNSFDIFFWRTLAGAEVDFIIYFNEKRIIPVEVKFRNIKKPTVSRSLRSFITAYQPSQAILITKNFKAQITIDGCLVHFIPFNNITEIYSFLT